ncbi:hypothetical protein SBA4_170024 [Candidatus Sulfopaludibacter sp. SbA4]|nr:hypothetical protein SBA4_170024 [Candidatus Sulfopaludibacter sp. SbA4]
MSGPPQLLSALARFAGEHIGPADAVPPCCVFFLRATEAVEVRCYVNLLKPEAAQERHELCLRQSARDSTGP